MSKRKLFKWFLVGAGINAPLNLYLICLFRFYESLPRTPGHPFCDLAAFILSSAIIGFWAWIIHGG